MATEGETKVFLAENASTEVYTHVEKEILNGNVNDSQKIFYTSTAPESITGLSATVLGQYVDGNGRYFRKDVLVFFRKDGKDTVVDMATYPFTISGTEISFTAAVTTAQADKVVASYSHTKEDRSDEITATTPAGGARPVEYVTVQGGVKIRIQKVQDARTISFEVLSADGGFVEYINGYAIVETIAGADNGSDLLEGSVGSQTRNPSSNTIVLKVDDPETGNDRIELFYNVVGVSSEGSMPSDGYYSENCTFECPPQDYCRLTRKVGQGA